MSKPNTQIVVANTDEGYVISIPGQVFLMKEQALKKAEPFTKPINSTEELEKVTAVCAELKGLSAAMEKTRAMVKKPFWDCCKAIEAKANDFKDPLDKRAEELEALAADWITRERNRVREELRQMELKREQAAAAARAEVEKAEAAKRAAEEAERKRIQAELDAAEAETRAEKARAKRVLEAAQAEQEAAQQAVDMAELSAAEAQETAQTTVVVDLQEPKHTGGRHTVRVQVNVTDIEALHAWDQARREEARKIGRNLPSFIKLEVRHRDFDQYINIIGEEERSKIPGVEFKVVGQFHSNINAPKLAIQ